MVVVLQHDYLLFYHSLTACSIMYEHGCWFIVMVPTTLFKSVRSSSQHAWTSLSTGKNKLCVFTRVPKSICKINYCGRSELHSVSAHAEYVNLHCYWKSVKQFPNGAAFARLWSNWYSIQFPHDVKAVMLEYNIKVLTSSGHIIHVKSFH